MDVLLKTGGVEAASHGGLDARAEDLRVAEAEDTGVVDLGPDGSVAVQDVAGADFDGDGALALLVPNGTSTGLDIGGDTVEVGRAEDVQGVVAT